MCIVLLVASQARGDAMAIDDRVLQLGPVSEIFFEPFARSDLGDLPTQPFKPIQNEFVLFEKNQGSYWLRFKLTNRASGVQQRIISFDFPHIAAAHLYQSEAREMIRVAAQMPLNQRTVVNRYPSLLFDVPGGATTQFYLNIRLQGKANQALEYEMRLYLVAQIIGLASFEGLFYLPPRPPSVSSVVILTTVTPMMCAFFLIHFGRDTLELRQNIPIPNRVMFWAGIALLFMMALAAGGATWVNLPMEFIGVACIVSLAIMALMIYRRGSRAAGIGKLTFWGAAKYGLTVSSNCPAPLTERTYPEVSIMVGGYQVPTQIE